MQRRLTRSKQGSMVKTMTPSAIETVFFDAFGTLIYLPSSVGEHYREVSVRHGLDLSADTLEVAFRARWKAASHPRNNTDGPRHDDDKGWWRELVREIISDVAPKALPSGFDFTGFFEELYAHFAQPGVWAAYPEAHEVLATLHAQGFRLGVISNFDRRLYQILDGLALSKYFTYVVISSEIGTDKPDPKIFEAALRIAGITASSAVHVGDEPDRDWGAEAVGIEVYKLTRPYNNLEGLPGWLASRSARQNSFASRPILK